MSLRRDAQKLTDSTKWTQIQEKVQEKNDENETSAFVNSPQKGPLLSSKEGSLLKSNENSAPENSKNYTKEEAAISDTISSSQPKEIDLDVTTKTGKKCFNELCAENEEQLINTTAHYNSEVADKQLFTAETFSEMVEVELQNKPSSFKVETEAAILEDVNDQKSRISCRVLHSEVVEDKSVNNYEADRDALLQNNQTAESLRPEPQDIIQSCHDETFHTLSEGEVKKCFSSEMHQRNIIFPRKGIADFSHTNSSTERRKMLRNSSLRKVSFRDRRKQSHFERPPKSKGTVKSLINKFEEMSAEKLQDTQNGNSQSTSAENHNVLSGAIHHSNDHSSNCNEETHPMKLTRNQDDSGISEGEETQSPKHIYQSINYRLIENYNRYLSEINEESSTLHDSMIRCFPDCVPKHIYINCPGRMYREIKQSRLTKLSRPNLIVKKPVPLPRSYSSPHYFHISECYSGHPHQQRESRKKCENFGSKLTQSEEEWADISEEEKEVLSYSQKLANVSKKLYDFKFPHNCSETSYAYDCCSPPRQRWNYNSKCRQEDYSPGDSSWETMSLHQGEEEDDDDKSSTTSSEHHYEAINDFLRFEPGNLSSYRSDQQNTDEFIRDSFNFLNTLSAEESDDIESPSALSTDSRSFKDSYGYKKKKLDGRKKLSFDSRDSITETILMYQELSSFRRSFNKKTFKNILKENALESNKLKKQPLFSKSSKEKLNFHVPWFSKTDNNQKQQSYESILEQLSIDSPDCKEKKKGKYFTMPHPKKISRSEQHFENLTDIDNSGNFDSSRRTSDSSVLSTDSKNRGLPEGTEASGHESSGNDNSLELQSSSSSSVSVGNRDSVVSCSSCADGGYICRKHLESTSNSSSSEEPVNYIREKKPIDVNFVKVRQRVESTGSEHSYFQIGDFSQSLNDEEQLPGSNRDNSNEYQNNSELYCDLSSFDSPSEAHMSVEQLSAQNGGKKLWSDISEVQKSGVLEKMTAQELKLQDAIFNVAMFEATYLRLLETYQEHFVRSSSNSDGYSLCGIISWHEWHLVFSDSLPIIEVSRRLIADIERRWDESYTSFDIADILYENVKTHFHAYVKYCSNKPYRDRMLKVLMNTKPKFAEVTRFLEASAECQGFLLEEFLMLPAHHISDLLHLIEEIVHWLPSNSSRCSMYNEIMDLLCKLKLECEKGALQMERMEEMLLLAQQIVFKDCKPLSLISVSRWLLKRGEMTHLVCFVPNKRTFGKNVRWSKVPVYVFLFNDYLIVTKRRSDESYNVLDYCPKNIVQAEFLDDQNTRSNLRPPSNYKNLLQLTLWSNHENKTVEMILSCPSESDKIRWGEALSSETTDSDSAERQDSYNVQCIRPYAASQADELTLFESDIVKVLRKIGDGWYKGKHIKDGNVGWFPVSCVTEDVHDFRMNHLSHGHKYSPVSPTGSSKIPVSPK